jgi:cobalt-zinc-cadmium efflux system protein
VGGFVAGSLALVSDAGHMLTDSVGLGLALVAAWVAARSPSHRYTYGLGRVEVVAAVVNGMLMCGVVILIVVEALHRFSARPAVDGGLAMVVAGLGLVVNVVVARTLLGAERTLNTRAALLHVMGDLLGSVAALSAGAVILATDWRPIDPLLSLVICLLIVISALRILKEGVHILLEGVPGHLDLAEVGQSMARVEGVVGVHDLHIWQVASTGAALSAHVVVAEPDAWEEVLLRLHRHVLEEFGITHVTLQPERAPTPVQIEGRPEG